MGKFLSIIKTNKNIPIYAAAVMLCMTLLSTYFVAGLYARFATSAESRAEARVAKFSIEGSGIVSEPLEAELFPGQSLDKVLNIHNSGEVAVEYTISATNVTKILPLQLSMKKEGSSAAPDTDGTTYKDQTLPCDGTDQYTLHIDWSADEKDPSLMGKVDYIMVTVTAVQID